MPVFTACDPTTDTAGQRPHTGVFPVSPAYLRVPHKVPQAASSLSSHVVFAVLASHPRGLPELHPHHLPYVPTLATTPSPLHPSIATPSHRRAQVEVADCSWEPAVRASRATCIRLNRELHLELQLQLKVQLRVMRRLLRVRTVELERLLVREQRSSRVKPEVRVVKDGLG